jgi:hypothetical protein
MIPLSALAHNWLATYMGLLTTAANAVFMWVSARCPSALGQHEPCVEIQIVTASPLNISPIAALANSNPLV